MLTLAKRPQPQLGNAPRSTVPMTEAAYAAAMRERAIREGHVVKPRIPSDDDFMDAMRDGCDTIKTIAAHVQCCIDYARRRLNRLEQCGLITAASAKPTLWSIK